VGLGLIIQGEKNGSVVEEKASSPFSFAFAFDDHNFV
jgi:hypothetical protein